MLRLPGAPALALLLIACQSSRPAADAQLSIDLAHFGIRGQTQYVFKETKHAKDVPPKIIEHFGSFADPGKPFQVGCVGDGHLPIHRLLTAGASPHYYLISFESGGRAHTFQVALVRREGSALKGVRMFSTGQKGIESLAQLKAAIESDSLALQGW